MALSIISLVISFLALSVSCLSLFKLHKLYQLFKKEDITSEEGNNVFINNNKF